MYIIILMSEHRDRDNIPTEVVLRRFFRDVQQSDIMTEIKDRRYNEKKKSRNARRKDAKEREARRKDIVF